MSARIQKLFSVIIPTYARSAELSVCLEALARQRLSSKCFEVLVVDDGSAAPPRSVVQQYKGRLDIELLIVEHGGPAAARNFGAKRACGEFLVFTDDDCRPAPQWLEALSIRCSDLPDHILGGRTLNALEGNQYAVTSQIILDLAYAHHNDSGVGGARFFASNNLAVPASRFRTLGGFDSTFKTSEDREFCDRWIQNGYRLTYAPEAVVYHAHALNLSGLWRQHLGYGRGAWRFHQIRRQRGTGRFRPEWRFYRSLALTSSARTPYSSAIRITSLMLVAQFANCVGFLYEAWRSA
jgi:GT2 family glycosyltransferase